MGDISFVHWLAYYVFFLKLTLTLGSYTHFVAILCRDGEEWQRIRNALAPKVMRPKVLEENIGNFNAVTKDAVERMVQIRDTNGEVPDLEEELSKWSTEGSYSLILFPHIEPL